MNRSAVQLVVSGRGSNGLGETSFCRNFFLRTVWNFESCLLLLLRSTSAGFLLTWAPGVSTPHPHPHPSKLLLTSCLRVIHSFSVLFVASLPLPSAALSPPHAKPFQRKLVFMWVRTEMQILAEQLKTQYWRGENVCQGENRTCWLVFQVQVKTGPLNQTSPRRVCSLPTPVNL